MDDLVFSRIDDGDAFNTQLAVDTNGDGQIDLNEYLTHAEQRFNKTDANADGFITSEEQTEAHKNMRAEFKQRREERRAKRQEQAQDSE